MSGQAQRPAPQVLQNTTPSPYFPCSHSDSVPYGMCCFVGHTRRTTPTRVPDYYHRLPSTCAQVGNSGSGTARAVSPLCPCPDTSADLIRHSHRLTGSPCRLSPCRSLQPLPCAALPLPKPCRHRHAPWSWATAPAARYLPPATMMTPWLPLPPRVYEPSAAR